MRKGKDPEPDPDPQHYFNGVTYERGLHVTAGLGDELLDSLLQRLASLVLQSFFLLLQQSRNYQ
jgi:hypothetical protein